MPNVASGGDDPAQSPEPGDGRLLAQRYRLLTAVGTGGMGTVWHAHDEVLGRDVAVKEVILPYGMTQEEREVHHKRTFREARTAARLAHPGVVTVYDVVEEDGRPWIIMELIKAPSLDQVIRNSGRLPPRRAAEIARQMLGALHTAHEAGVLHRDVKPSNVLVAPGDRVVLTDFGIATAAGDVTLTQTGLVMGSPAYIAPERARGRTAGPASDLWALGITMYAMVEGGSSPYDRSEPMASLIAVISEDPEPPAHAGPLRPVIDGLLRKDPDERLSALETAAMLDQVVRGLAATRRNTLPLTQVSDDSPPTSALDAVPAEEDVPAVPVVPDISEMPAEPAADPAADRRTDTGDNEAAAAAAAAAAAEGDVRAAAAPATETPAADSPAAPPEPSAPEAAAPPPAGRDEPAATEPAAARTGTETTDRATTAADPAATAPGAPTAAAPTIPPTAGPTGPMRPSSAGRTALVITAIALVALLTLGVWAWVSRDSDNKPSGAAQPTRQSASSSASASASPSPSASATQGGRRSASPGVPAGFREYTDSTGFSLAVPSDWTGPERRSPSVFFYAPDRRSYVQIDQTDNPNPSALDDWRRQESSAPDRFSNYRRIKLGPTGDQPPVPDTGDGSKSADWEFTWGTGSAQKHVLDRGFVTSGHGYAILISAPAGDWTATIERLQPVFTSFRPAR